MAENYKERTTNYYKNLAELGYDVFFTYNNYSMKETMQIYFGFCRKCCEDDPQLCKFLDLAIAIMETDPASKNSYINETRLMQKLIPGLLDYEVELNQKVEEYKKNPKDKYTLEDAMVSLVVADGLLYTLTIIIRGMLEYIEPYEGCDNILSKNFFPLFTHLILMNDISPMLAHNKPASIGLINAARLYPNLLTATMGLKEDKTILFRLWERNGDDFILHHTDMDVSNISKEDYAENNGLAIWPIFLLKALKKLNLLSENPRPGEVIECCFGPDYRYECKDQYLQDLKKGSSEVAFYNDIVSWIDNGYPLSIYLNKTTGFEEGWYIITGCYIGKNDKLIVRLYNPRIANIQGQVMDAPLKDIYAADLLQNADMLDVNTVVPNPDLPVLRQIDYDVIDINDIDAFDKIIVDKKMALSYCRCAFELYVSLIKVRSTLRSETKEFANIYPGLYELVDSSAMSYGNYESIIQRPIDFLKDQTEKFRQITDENTADASDLQKLKACDAIDYLCEIFYRYDKTRKDPYKEFVRSYAKKFARAWMVSKGMTPEKDTLEHKAELLITEDKFNKLVSDISIITMLNPSDNHLAKALKAYSTL